MARPLRYRMFRRVAELRVDYGSEAFRLLREAYDNGVRVPVADLTPEEFERVFLGTAGSGRTKDEPNAGNAP